MRLADALKKRNKDIETARKSIFNSLMPTFSLEVISDISQLNNINGKLNGNMVICRQTGEVFVYTDNSQWKKIIGETTD